MAASKPELVAELLREAELVVKEAPPAVRGDMVQVVTKMHFLLRYVNLLLMYSHIVVKL